MPKRPYINQLSIKNYRALRELKIDKLKLINLIGGLNTSGKTSLLEAIFTFMDRLSPVGLVRPLIFRQLPPTIKAAKEVMFYSGTDTCSLEAKTRDNKTSRLSFKWETQPTIETGTTQSSLSKVERNTTSEVATNLVDKIGLTIRLSENNREVLRRHVIDSTPGVTVKDDLPANLEVPSSALLSRLTLHYPTDIASRYSKALQAGKKKELLSLLKMVAPDLQSLEILALGDVTVLHAERPDDKLVPMSFVGDGALTLLSIALAIIECENGVVVIDEFDAAIHYSKLESIWAAMAKLAVEYNCQLFIATHSLESIRAACSIMEHRNHNDFAYVRLDRIGEDIVATKYLFDDLSTALRHEWEVR